ncbi:MAG: HAMP domain-containing protein [Treponema sp.]|jgi:class 3 adenylate cyclase/HAMP domain-containing protein|nr:HAMP domain-containing protein [Treponema sp.]
MKKSTGTVLFTLCAAVCLFASFFCIARGDLLKRPVFQRKTAFMTAMTAKYEKDGNLYVIDSGGFRLLCMTADGEIRYTIRVNKLKEYVKMFDLAVDGAGNLYVYMMEIEYDAFLTKRDIIRKYNKQGKQQRDIFVMDYAGREDRPRAFPQFGSLRCRDGALTFSRAQKNSVLLYAYDVFTDTLSSSVFSLGTEDYAVGRLCLKDFGNFIYATRTGGIYEVRDGGKPVLRADFDFSPKARGGTGGIIPWHLEYGGPGEIFFFDMASGMVRGIGADGELMQVIPEGFFAALRAQGGHPLLTGFAYYQGRFSGVYGETVWYYNGKHLTAYTGGLPLPPHERLAVAAAQLSFLAAVVSFLLGVYLLIVAVLNRFISLFIKQAVIIIPITVIAFFVFYMITFNAMTDQLNKEIFKSLNLTVSVASNLITGEDIEELRGIKDSRSGTYRKLSRTLKNIVNDNKDEWSKLYYAAVYTGANFEYYLLSSNDEINMFRPGIFYEEESENYQMLKAGKSFAGIAEYLDGMWAYSNIGIFNRENTLAGILEIGLDMTSYQISNIQLREKIALVAAFICLIILCFLIAVMSIIVRQLRMTADILKAIGNGDYRARISYRARDELGRVSCGLNRMAEKLEKQFNHISALNASSIRFVPLQFMEHLGVADITKMKLGDHVQRNLTVLFFDIRSFSVHSEMMSAKDNFLFINRVLGTAGPVFRRHKGFVDKYLGDSAMVLFDNAAGAVRAGVELYRRLILSPKTRVAIGGDGISIGIGVHSGPVMMGIVGENERLSSTVISKNVNLASRLESLTKQINSGMLISRDTMNQLADHEGEFQYRFLGMIQAAGLNEVTGVFDMLDALPGAVRSKRIATKGVFESGIRKYHTKDYQAAYERFKAVAEADRDDVCAANYLEEAKRHLNNPDLPSVFIIHKK